MNTQAPRIVITPGEPSGVGPDLCIKLAQDPLGYKTASYNLVIVADPVLLEARAQQLGLPINIIDPQTSWDTSTNKPGNIQVLPVKQTVPGIPGQADTDNAEYVLKTLQTAAQGCLSKEYDAMVTGPVHKGIINDAGIPFTGHTEFLARACGTDNVVMMLCVPGLRVALATTHLPLSKVSKAITFESLEKTLGIILKDLTQFFGVNTPRVIVCGLNPHAGEDGHLGREEIDTIKPVIEKFRCNGFNINGPVPADTAFTSTLMKQADVILTMYHDQGLPVLKHMGFGKAINVTLGLPIIRTSVDHGTALEIAGTGEADISSLIAAIHTAADMIESSKTK